MQWSRSTVVFGSPFVTSLVALLQLAALCYFTCCCVALVGHLEATWKPLGGKRAPVDINQQGVLGQGVQLCLAALVLLHLLRLEATWKRF